VVTPDDTPNDTPDYDAIAAGLDRWQPVPTEVLSDVVTRHGLCLQGLWPAQEPDSTNDRELATLLCAGCPVIDECLELELRSAGASTAGVWGAMPEDDRRALHRVWQRHREHQPTSDDQEGGPRP
jgi:WhiB family transcriptional regulator, redox-sensing transcriptional regulator